MPTKDSADKHSNRTDEENTWKAAACSCVVAWQLGPRSGPRRCPHLNLSRCFPAGPKRQSPTHLEPKSSAW
jgi:hypothetical protein